jgi:APA family basic amino acid/polyamine antiporter
MLKYVMFFDTIGLSLAAVAIFLLRKKTKALDGTGIYTIKWFPLVPLIFIISYWFVTINIFITFKENPYAALICLATYVVGLIIYYASTYKKKSQTPIT